MKKRKREISTADVERAVFHTLKDEGLLAPDSEEEIEALEEELGNYPPGTSDVAEVFRLLKEKAAGRGETSGSAAKGEVSGESAIGKQIADSLAQAARRGRKIPQRILDLMERDRKQAEDGRDSK